MNKQTTTKNPPGAPKGNQNAAKPDDKRGVWVSVYLAPETVELLAPFTAKRQRSRTIDQAVQLYLQKATPNE